jgi:hypothetical protein
MFASFSCDFILGTQLKKEEEKEKKRGKERERKEREINAYGG